MRVYYSKIEQAILKIAAEGTVKQKDLVSSLMTTAGYNYINVRLRELDKRGMITRDHVGGREILVNITPQGRAMLGIMESCGEAFL